MKRPVLAAMAATVIALSACGANGRASAQIQSGTAVLGCLRGDGLAGNAVSLPPTAATRHRELTAVVSVDQGLGGLIAVYRDPGAAERDFGRQFADVPALLEGNTVLALGGAPTSSPSSMQRIEQCAFGPHPHPESSLEDTAGPGRSGNEVVGESGCLGCHTIGLMGNDGPGENLTHIGAQLSSAKIAHALVDPVAPMPSYRGLKRSDPRAWGSLVSYLSQLR